MIAVGGRPQRWGRRVARGRPEGCVGQHPSGAPPSNPVAPASSDRLLRAALLLRRVPGPLHVVSDGASLSTQGAPPPALPPASGDTGKNSGPRASRCQMQWLKWRSLRLRGGRDLGLGDALGSGFPPPPSSPAVPAAATRGQRAAVPRSPGPWEPEAGGGGAGRCADKQPPQW